MQRRVLINADDYEIRICVTENTKLIEYLLERRDEERIVGNIYKGVVTSIIPGMEAAFVDIGLPRNAFLYIHDIYPRNDFEFLTDELLDEDEEEENGTGGANLPPVTIRDLLKEQQHILVQLHKEPIGAKACRVTSNITLPGRFLVLLPNTRHIGVSRKIENEADRERLKNLVSELAPPNMGVIVRTAGYDCSREDFENDLSILLGEWETIRKKSETSPAPTLIFKNTSMVYQFIREMANEELDEIVIDEPRLYSDILEYLKTLKPELAYRVTYYDESTPLFRAYSTESEIHGLRSKKVWLHNGGYIIIEETEAMTVIDVNTGRYLGKHNLEETVFKTNLEAATEIARQLRLRDIGGIIIVDFIDMIDKTHQRQLIDHFTDLLKRDRSRCNTYPLTELGLLQMTRKRVRKSLNRKISQPCPYCKRDGAILSLDSMIIQTFRTFEEICKEEGASNVTLRVHPRIAAKIKEEKTAKLRELGERYNAELKVVPDNDLHFEQIIEEIS